VVIHRHRAIAETQLLALAAANILFDRIIKLRHVQIESHALAQLGFARRLSELGLQ